MKHIYCLQDNKNLPTYIAMFLQQSPREHNSVLSMRGFMQDLQLYLFLQFRG